MNISSISKLAISLAIFGLCACASPSDSGSAENNEQSSDSTLVESSCSTPSENDADNSSSSVENVKSSSSLSTMSSSSSQSEPSSSSKIEESKTDDQSSSSVTPGTGSFETWYGDKKQERIITGLDDGNDESGYWFSYDDYYNGGNSSIYWPKPAPGPYDEDDYQIIDQCGGVCGTAVLGNQASDPFVGIGFNLTGPDQTGADVTDWNGICLVYSIEGDWKVELSVENESTVTERNNLVFKLDASKHSVDIPWKSFRPEEGWGMGYPLDEYLKTVSIIKIKNTGKAGAKNRFNFTRIGQLGKCGDDFKIPEFRE